MRRGQDQKRNLNTAHLSPELYATVADGEVLLCNPANGEFIEIAPQVSTDCPADTVLLTKYIKKSLQIPENETVPLILCRKNSVLLSNIFIQELENIRENIVLLSAQDAKSLFGDGKKQNFRLYQLKNTLTGELITVKRNHIRVSAELQAGQVKLNKKQRAKLGLELPFDLTERRWTCLQQRYAGDTDALATLERVYVSADHILDTDAPYADRLLVQDMVKKTFPPALRISPVVESFCMQNRTSAKHLCDFYVGKSTISLVCKRPFENDEGMDVVRITKSNMHLLGIEEMDKVILQHRNRKISCRVLELDDEKAFLKANRPANLGFTVGIPAHIRQKLQITNLSTTVKVDRDTAFLLRKSINEQVVPILLTLFSADLFRDVSVLLSAVFSLVAIPLVVYLNLSSKRNMRG